MNIVTGLFHDHERIEPALDSLKQAGFDWERVSLITAVNAEDMPDLEEEPEKTAVEGAALGGTLGSVLGLLGSILFISLPGIGPVLTSGLMGTAAGGVLGGYLGSLYSVRAASESELDIKEELADGAVLMIVHTDGVAANSTTTAILKDNGAEHVELHDVEEGSS